MNFGQVLAILLNGGRASSDSLGRAGAHITMQQPAGVITEPYIALHLSNGVCIPWIPTNEAIFATNWTAAQEAEHGATEGLREAAHSSR